MDIRSFLKAARKYNASDIHIVGGLPPALRVSGEIVMSNSPEVTYEQIHQILSQLMNSEQKTALTTKLQLCFSITDEEFGRFRVTIYHRGGKPELAIRLCAKEIKTRNELGLPAELDDLTKKPSGLILITGPTGVGKTTTMSYLIDLINCEKRCKIVTIEDPIEYVHSHKHAIVIQQELYTDFLSFPSALVHVLRQDPDVIGVGEMRDYETISTALTAAETGHLVIATLHTPDVSQSVERIIGVFPPEQHSQVIIQLAGSLQGIISQQLVPSVDYKERFLAYELLICNTAARNVIRQNECFKLYNILEIGKTHGMRTMDASLGELYEKGLISYDSLLSRVAHPDNIRKRYNKSSV
jgi:twitching motility protein PilT